jgi:hypothetical protein
MKHKRFNHKRNVYPTIETIMKMDRTQLALCLRQLPRPVCLREVRLLELIQRRFKLAGGWNEDLWNEVQIMMNGVN